MKDLKLLLLEIATVLFLGLIALCIFLFTLTEQLRSDLRTTASTYQAMIEYTTTVNDELQLRENLTSVIIDAARSYNLDPKLLAAVIKSESNFRPNPSHAIGQVGPGGVNVKAHKHLQHNPYSYVGNIYASAEILAKYVDDSDSLTLAVTRYKSLSPLGMIYAKQVIADYEKMK